MSVGRELIKYKKSFIKVLRKEFSYKVKNKGKIMLKEVYRKCLAQTALKNE